MTARETALRALIAFRREGAWPEQYLKKAGTELSPEEAGLASTLTYGVLENRAYLDFLLDAFGSRPVGKLTPQVLDALRLGTYQLVFLDRIPASAAVNETVRQVRACGNSGAAGYANAVLRAISRALPDGLPPIPRDDLLTYLTIRYNHPRWFVGKMRKRLGDEGCEALLAADNETPPVTARVNTLKTTREELLPRLWGEGIPAREHPWLPQAVTLDSAKLLLRSSALEKGLIYIQDTASQLCAEALDPREGEQILDLCAAPGGKTLLCAQKMGGRGTIVSMDLHPHRVELIEKNAARYGAECVRPMVGDASKRMDPFLGRFDAVLCDVPCSGMGVIRKKPDVRYKDGDAVKALPAVQSAILENAAAYLKQGGRLVYSTCTVLREENEAVVSAFLERHPEFSREEFDLPGVGPVPEGEITLWPHVHGTDGFFIAKLRKH